MTEPAPIPRAPDTRTRKDLPVVPWTGSWGTASIQQALDLHDQGQFLQSSQLSETVQRDDRVATALNTRCKGLLGLAREISPSPVGDRRKAKQAAKDLATLWPETDITEALVQALRWCVLMGFALIEVIWSGDADRWAFSLKVWHPQFVWFNWYSRTFIVNTAEGPVAIVPGDGKWFLLAPEGDYRCWIQGAIRSIAIPWLGRQYAFRDWMRFNEIYGLPIRKAIVPAQTNQDDKDGFYQDIANAGSAMTVSCPQGTDGQGYDIELVEATATGWETFRNATEDSDKRITLGLLGQNLTTEVSGGSFAAAKVHGQVRQDYLEADERGLTSGFRRQVLRLWAAFNYGDPDLAPVVRYDTQPPEDEKARAETLVAVSTALLNLSNTASDLDSRKLLERFNVPLKDLDPEDGVEDASAQIFQHHLQFGIVTINEVRKALGLPPVEGGDQPPAPLAEGTEPDASPVGTSRALRRHALARYDHIDFTPPDGVRDEAARGLEWREEHDRGGTEVGVARARDLGNGRAVSPETARRMKAYFDRHESDQKGEGWSPGEDGFPSAGRIAWALWGGDPGRAWAGKLVDQIEAADDKATASRCDHAHALAVDAPPPAQAAQSLVDDTASIARDRAAKALRPQVTTLLDTIGRASSYDEIRAAVRALADDLDPDALAQVTEQSLLLAQLAGRYAVHRLESDE